MGYQVSHVCSVTGNIVVICTLIFIYFWIANWKTILIGKMEIKFKVAILRAFDCNNSFEVIVHHD
jgi:hypothetical protein